MSESSTESKKVTIVTHSSKFHTDDIFAVATLTLVLGEENIKVVRSRDQEVIKMGGYVVDVGGVYDFDKKRFDHHQIGGAGKRDNGIPYASFGLVWKHFGEKICGDLEISEKIDQTLVQPIDAGDNGIEIVDLRFKNIHPNTIVSYFESFNPTWKSNDTERLEPFIKAVNLARDYIIREIVIESDLIEVREIVRNIYELSADKRLVVLDRFYPVSDALNNTKEVLFSIYPQEGNGWVIKAIKDDDESFVYRKLLPKEWAGQTSMGLEKITGVLGANSCHNDRYIATAKSKEAILKMAEIALNS
ncbi:MAG: hypothetical protein CEO12_227 [Parcubacteria group bacterium Gr01-1014_46]|nr:MAG: hypothetical protein CEO12_227 [Parcubacteria group bacterium Gr01-1014_46]